MSTRNIYSLEYYKELVDVIKDSIACYLTDSDFDDDDEPILRHRELKEMIQSLPMNDLICFKLWYMIIQQSCIKENIKMYETPVTENDVNIQVSDTMSIKGNTVQIKLNNDDIYNINVAGLASISRKCRKYKIEIPSTDYIHTTLLNNLYCYIFAKEVNDNNIYAAIKSIQKICKTKDAMAMGELAGAVLNLNERIKEKITHKNLMDGFLSMFSIENKDGDEFVLRYQFEKLTLTKK